MKHITVLPAVLWFCLATPASAAPVSPESLAAIIKVSGVAAQMAQVPGLVVHNVQQGRTRGGPIPDDVFAQLQAIALAAHDPAAMLAIVEAELRSDLTEEDAQTMLAWYQSDLGRAITQAEEAGSTLAAVQDMAGQVESLMADEVGVRMAHRLDDLVNLTGMVLHLKQKSAIAGFAAVSSARDPGNSARIEAFKSHVYRREAAMRAQVEPDIILSIVYTYRNLDLASVEKYLAFNESPAARRYNETMMRGHLKALDQGLEKMIAGIARLFKPAAPPPAK